jgi:hypothetical protein
MREVDAKRDPSYRESHWIGAVANEMFLVEMRAKESNDEFVGELKAERPFSLRGRAFESRV